MITMDVNGVPYTDFINASVTISVDVMSNDFSFTASAVDLFPPFKDGDLVEISVNKIKRLSGYVGEIEGVEEEGSHIITYSGRDRASDFVDSSVYKFNDLRASNSLTLKKIIEKIIQNIGSNLKVVDNVNPAPFNAAEDIVDADDGTMALDLSLEYARKRQVLLSSNADGDILISQSTAIDSGATLQRVKDGDNNIIGQSWSIKSSQSFNAYVHRGQLDPRALNFGGFTDVATVEEQGARVIDTDVREGRQKVTVEAKGYSNAQLTQRGKWQKQLAKAGATKFNCSVKDHVKPGEHDDPEWRENTLVQINSNSANITRKMLINSLTFSEGEGQPTITSFEFVEKNVYTVNDKILNQKPIGDQNDVFKF